MVQEAIASALPQPRKKTERPHPKLQAVIPFIDAILQGDRQAPRLYIDEQTPAGIQLQNLLGLLSPGREGPGKA
jgi:hypothetical protein